ncbi:Imm32 family immunity protein [Promicromonospora sp. NFX87]|uniref:Imm32 family immunity protein n=1 Tax=Promicromonospora sp. NFX87 TaxID=3402691 RepID=UPI003AFB30B9
MDTTGGGSVLKALHSDSTRELELSGTRSELLALGRKLRSGRGEILLAKVPNPFPYTRSLSRIEFQQASGKIRVSSSGDGETLEVTGRLESFSLLAENIEGFASEADQGDHLHVDYFPEHDYLAEGSGSLVVAIDSYAIQTS